jgi:hypothetical protein
MQMMLVVHIVTTIGSACCVLCMRTNRGSKEKGQALKSKRFRIGSEFSIGWL